MAPAGIFRTNAEVGVCSGIPWVSWGGQIPLGNTLQGQHHAPAVTTGCSLLHLLERLCGALAGAQLL